MLPSPLLQAFVPQPSGSPTALSMIVGEGELQLRRFIVAGLVLAFAAGLIHLINLAWAKSLARQMRVGALPPETRTRMAVARRLIAVVIWVVAAGIALGQFPELRVLSAGLLASAGVSGLIVGFAARNTLGNAVAGVIIAFAQPVRIGDDVEFRGERGTVEDINFFFSVLRLTDGKRLIVPNDVLSSEVVKNLTMGDVTRVARVDVLVPPRADAVGMREKVLGLARGYAGLDPAAAPPEVYWVKITEVGTLMRLIATCTDGPAADRLGQQALGLAASGIFRDHL